MVRFPPVLLELAIVPRTTASRPFRHSPDETSWSASLVNSSSTAFGSIRSRASTYLLTTSRIAASSLRPAPSCANHGAIEAIQHRIANFVRITRSEEHTSELQSLTHLVCRHLP